MILSRLPRALALTLLCLLTFLLASLPRLQEITVPVTTDESLWIQRTSLFAAAVLDRDWASTYQTGHPGVTTMWVAGLGMGLSVARDLNGERLSLLDDAQLAAFASARRAMALAGSLLLAVIAFLAARLFGLLVGATAAALLSLDPWMVALSRVIHLDGLLASLIAICLLACLVRWRAGGGVGYLLLAGVAGGLAVITKSAGLALLPPMVLLAALPPLWRASRRRRLVGIADLALVAALALVAIAAAWPAVRADPLGTAASVVSFGVAEGGEAHELGSYFLGQAVPDPGPPFYPLTLALRLSPLVLVGVLVWAGLVVFRARLAGDRGRSLASTLLLCAALVLLVMTLGPKKQERYVLPTVPLLAIVAAAGFVGLASSIPRPAFRPALLAGVGVAQLGLCAGARPSYFTYYSPLLGGTTTAAYVMPIGWGEGIEPVARYLNQRRTKETPDVLAPASVRVALRTQTKARVVDPKERQDTAFLLSYVNAEQRRIGVPLLPTDRPVVTVRINGVEYAVLYARSAKP